MKSDVQLTVIITTFLLLFTMILALLAAQEDKQTVKMVEAGANPLVAACAISSSGSKRQICAILAAAQ
jgi:hypothetical protein